MATMKIINKEYGQGFQSDESKTQLGSIQLVGHELVGLLIIL
jgi:hypothetical protein